MAGLREPRHFAPMTGKTYKLGRIEIAFTTCGEHTGGAYTLCETIEPPGSGAGLHRHPTYDETFIICAGHFDFHLAGKDIKVGPGETVFVPRGTPHSFTCAGPEPGRQLIISSPGGIFEAFIDEVVNAQVDSGDPSKRAPAIDFRAIAAKYGMEFLS
jgi:mannose-6-phosphate isomerase-like protein (cupin superfamily)